MSWIKTPPCCRQYIYIKIERVNKKNNLDPSCIHVDQVIFVLFL